MEYLYHNALMNRLCIKKLDVTYRKTIVHNLLCIFSCRLVYLEPITVSINNIYRIIVPFNSMHASPATGNMGEYKTLYRLKLQLF